LKRHFWYL